MKVILSSEDNHSVDIVYPIECTLEEVIEKDVLPYTTNYIVVDIKDLPPRRFYPSMRLIDKQLSFDIPTCKKMLLSWMRNDREIKFKNLDKEFMIALETGDQEKMEEIKSKKQQLRDITKTELPDTIEELIEFYPDILK
jgi:hypothetical protein